ncbi:4-hydroxy-tetrahydrodipicolinate reductase [Mangrovicoccus sp. HB161399]|uniref:4-hydroxy-tetrahydrodipicolinate reductase n=1 Tax=Mangrovicoccus sp. HB161399 TaxID=2720392 RepID=UPI001553D57F|nr:4-hydroxy-tetrahydrodipicolinate reductase [Mangrovicoccus sp. HB161399]
MTELPGIVITGAAGRMGRMLVQAVAESGRARLAGAVVRPGHAWVGQDVGTAMGGPALGVTVSDELLAPMAQAQAVIDFTTPELSTEVAAVAAQARAVHVIGTTGFEPGDLAKIAAAARHAVVVRAGNMSLGVNLLVGLTRRVAAVLGTDWDIDVVEAHHRHKVDAPSGTALMLGEAAAEGRGKSLEELQDMTRLQRRGAREEGSIGFSAIRGGDVVGEHDVIFASPGERIVLRHLATDRGIFARGAVAAALWGQDKGPGEYDMMDVLGLE